MLVFARTDTGCVRSSNEDMIAVAGWSSRDGRGESLAPPIESDWALLADGMGGHACGEVASELAIEFLAELMTKRPTSTQIGKALTALHARFHELMVLHRGLEGMGTTIVGVVVEGGTATAFNIGDSRAYRFCDGSLTRLSEDHSYGHMLTQCVGGHGQSALQPHFSYWQRSYNEIILLCSDGLTNLVPEDRIAAILSAAGKDAADSLVEAALENGGTDNISVVIAQ